MPLVNQSCLPVCMCNIRRFTDCESCTRPISTNPGSMEAGEYGLTCGTCFVARLLELVAVAGLLWILRCVLGAAGFRFFFFERTRPAASMRPPCLIYLFSSNEEGKKASSYRGAYRVPIFSLSVCLCLSVCVTFVAFTDCESCTRPISTNPGSTEAGEYGLTRGTYAVSSWTWSPGCCGFRGVLWVGRIFSRFFFRFFSSNAHDLLQV